MGRNSLLALLLLPSVVWTRNDDRFNYRETVGRDFGPEDWNRVTCDDVTQCLGWPDDWLLGEGWGLEINSCKWCPKGSNRCGAHHQSPIDLERNRGVEGHPEENECIDSHWMKYEDSTCTFDMLESRKAFTVERHALKITQPLEELVSDGSLRIACPASQGRRFGRIDFSKGFSDWWFLSHVDIKIPSEHTQDGKRYSAEAQLAHFYSIPGEVAGVDNEMATVSIFMQVYDNAPPYPFLDRLICQWRKAEEEVRETCGLPSVGDPYPGCWHFTRGHTPSPVPPTFPTPDVAVEVNAAQDDGGETRQRRKLLRDNQAAHDVLVQNSLSNTTTKKILMDDINFRDADWTDEQWAEWIESLSSESKREGRNLLEYDSLSYHNYQFLIDVKTEYYFRYSGTSTVPPCYGPFTAQTRGFSNHWRVLKDPIRIHKRQLSEMQRLIRERIAPPNDPFKACQPDTAADIRQDPVTGEEIVSVARPLQDTERLHYKVFCECKDWPSKWPEDRDWCRIEDVNKRFYETPYNFETPGF